MKHSRKRQLTRREIGEICQRHDAGETRTALARAFDRSPSTISRVIRKARGEARRIDRPMRQVLFRLPDRELQAFRHAAQGWGFPHTAQAYRALVRIAIGEFEVLPADVAPLLSGFDAFRKVGVNLNQIARKLNRGAAALSASERAALAEGLRAVRGLESTFLGVLDDVRMRQGYVARRAGAVRRHGSAP